MIDIKDLVKNKEKYIVAFTNRQMNLTKQVNKVVELQEKYISELGNENKLRAELNLVSKEIGQDPKNNELKKKAGQISSQAKEKGNLAKEIQEEMIEIASYFPNIPAEEVIVGTNEEDNVVIETFGEVSKKDTPAHWDILDEKGLTLDEEAGIISGTRQVIYNDKGALLLKAIERFMLDSHNKSGYIMVEPPVIVNKQALWNTGQLPKFEEDLYKLENGQYLIPTAEVPVTNLSAGKIYKESELPIRLYAGTSCFRKEAGSAGRDTRGLTRLHQFRKVELVTFGKASDEEKDFNEMLRSASQILIDLEIPHRHLLLSTGDMGFGARKTIDIEVWMPGQDRWVEISSVSTAGNFQSRRLKARVDINGNKEFINTYNGSALAIGRTIAAILENYYNKETKMVEVPVAIQKYLEYKEF